MTETLVHEEAAAPDSARTAAPESLLLGWHAQIRILGDPEIWRSLAFAFGISSVALGVLVGFITGTLSGFLTATLGGMGVLFVLFLIAGVAIDLCGGFNTGFALTTEGVRSTAGKGAAAAADAAFWTGVLTGSPGAAGAGLLARAEQDTWIPYEEITRVVAKAGRHYIYVKGGLLTKPIALYCTAENYPRAVAILKERCHGARFEQES